MKTKTQNGTEEKETETKNPKDERVRKELKEREGKDTQTTGEWWRMEEKKGRKEEKNKRDKEEKPH